MEVSTFKFETRTMRLHRLPYLRRNSRQYLPINQPEPEDTVHQLFKFEIGYGVIHIIKPPCEVRANKGNIQMISI